MNKDKKKYKNKDLIESYKLTTVRDHIGIYGQRLILRLVEATTAEGVTEGLNFSTGFDLRKINVTEDIFYQQITMPLSYITMDSDNRSKPRAAIKALMQEIIEAEDEDGSWFAFPFLSYAKVTKGMLTVEVRKELWQVMRDFRKGFRRYELQTALKLKSTYSLRLYKLVSEQHDINYLDFQISELKKMLGVADKYARTRDFFVKVLEPAKAELDKISPWSFSYIPLTSRLSSRGRASIIGVRIFPVYQSKYRDRHLEDTKLIHTHSSVLEPGLTKETKAFLISEFGFKEQGLLNNRELFDKAAKNFDLMGFLQDIKLRVKKVRPKNVSGYVRNAIKIELDSRGVEY